MPDLYEEVYSCNCLRAHVKPMRLDPAAARDIYDFVMKDVLRRLLDQNKNREFLNLSFLEFQTFYMKATNEMLREKLTLREFTGEAVSEAIARRKCAGCGFHAYKLLRESPEVLDEIVLEAA